MCVYVYVSVPVSVSVLVYVLCLLCVHRNAYVSVSIVSVYMRLLCVSVCMRSLVSMCVCVSVVVWMKGRRRRLEIIMGEGKKENLYLCVNIPVGVVKSEEREPGKMLDDLESEGELEKNKMKVSKLRES